MRYVAVDIASVSLQQFVELRILDKDSKLLRSGDFARISHLICADMGVDSLTKCELLTYTWKNGNTIFILVI